jgi:hypothetical protein
MHGKHYRGKSLDFPAKENGRRFTPAVFMYDYDTETDRRGYYLSVWRYATSASTSGLERGTFFDDMVIFGL